MAYPFRRALAALLLFSLLVAMMSRPFAAAQAAASDGLSGAWQVSRTCLTLCVSPRPVLKIVRHLSGDVFMTKGHAPDVLYRLGYQVLVHSPTDSLLLTVVTPGQLMSGSGVGANGSTFRTTWRCVAPPKVDAAGAVVPASEPAAQPAHLSEAMGSC